MLCLFVLRSCACMCQSIRRGIKCVAEGGRETATTESKPGGGFFKELSSLVMVCSLPKATSLRNINPKPWEVETAKSKNVHIKGMASQTISYKNNISDCYV